MADGDTGPRRGFLKAATGGIAGLVGALAAIPGLGFLAHPLRAKTVTGADQPIRVAAPDDVKPGKPLRASVVGQFHDGWLRIDQMKLGAAWLVRTPEGRVQAFSTVCPHLGCGIDWDEKSGQFECPCHKSGFGLDGRCLYGPSPRGLDELQVVTTDTEVRVRYQRFKTATKEKEPIG